MERGRKMARYRFVIFLFEAVDKTWRIGLRAANGRLFNHSYNSRANAKKSADSLLKSFKKADIKKDY